MTTTLSTELAVILAIVGISYAALAAFRVREALVGFVRARSERCQLVQLAPASPPEVTAPVVPAPFHAGEPVARCVPLRPLAKCMPPPPMPEEPVASDIWLVSRCVCGSASLHGTALDQARVCSTCCRVVYVSGARVCVVPIAVWPMWSRTQGVSQYGGEC